MTAASDHVSWNQRIRVYVVKVPGRKHLHMKWVDPDTGTWRWKTTEKTNRREAERVAGDHEDQLNSLQGSGDGSLKWDTFLDL